MCDGKMTKRSSSTFNHQSIHLQPKMPDFCLMPRAAPTARPAPLPSERETNFGHYVAADAMNQPSCGSSAQILVGA